MPAAATALIRFAAPPVTGAVSARPYRGAPQTVAMLQRAAVESQGHMVVRQVAERVCGNLDSKDYLSEYLAIYHFVLARCRYMRDPRAVELVRAPWIICEELLRGGRPNLDCDDSAVLIAALCLAVGGQVRFVTVAFQNMFYQGQQQYSHVFVQAMEPQTKKWITLDPVAADKTDQMMRKIKAAAVWAV